jgi:uncharacterized protein (PEP-CTERM system associated)
MGLTVSESWLDTKRPGGSDSSDFATLVRPTLQWASRSGRLQGRIDYALSAAYHTDREVASELQNFLDAALTLEALDSRVFIDASASATQRSVSPFGQQSANANLSGRNGNVKEIGTVRLAPYAKGLLGNVASYEVRYSAAATNARDSKEGDSTTEGWSAALRSVGGAALGWSLDASSQQSSFRTGGRSESERLTATLLYRPDVDWQLLARGGVEGNEIGVGPRERFDSWGMGVTWRPTERSNFEIERDERYFGTGWRVTLEHRFPQSSFRFTSNRDVNRSSDPRGAGQPITRFDLLFFQFASAIPDPERRRTFVLSLLQALGEDPNAVVLGGFLSNEVTVQQREDLSWNWSFKRLVLGLQAFRSRTQRLDNAGQPAANGQVRQFGYSGTMSYRLTPTASASLVGNRLKSLGDPGQPGTDLKSLALTLSEQLGPRTSASLNARYSVFNSQTDPYRESAITASLAFRF